MADEGIVYHCRLCETEFHYHYNYGFLEKTYFNTTINYTEYQWCYWEQYIEDAVIAQLWLINPDTPIKFRSLKLIKSFYSAIPKITPKNVNDTTRIILSLL